MSVVEVSVMDVSVVDVSVACGELVESVEVSVVSVVAVVSVVEVSVVVVSAVVSPVVAVPVVASVVVVSVVAVSVVVVSVVAVSVAVVSVVESVVEVESEAGSETGSGALVDPPLEVPELVWVAPLPERSESSCALVMQVSAPLASLTQSSLVRTRLAKKSPMSLAASANHVLKRENILLKKLSANDCDRGVELAVVEAMASKLRLRSCMALARTGAKFG